MRSGRNQRGRDVGSCRHGTPPRPDWQFWPFELKLFTQATNANDSTFTSPRPLDLYIAKQGSCY